ncbi:hypothetical protein QJQ45_004107 [Haematococcus lacustris]|nr:hypothetical protein QJQ45_004107 [Haematococcus lacustris]
MAWRPEAKAVQAELELTKVVTLAHAVAQQAFVWYGVLLVALSAQREIALWFKPEELAEWNPVASPWIYE